MTTRLDNAIYSSPKLRAVPEAKAADAVVLSLHETRGPWRWYQLALAANGYGAAINRKSYLEGSGSTFAPLQALATVPNLTRRNQLTHQLLGLQLTSTPLEPAAGRARVPMAAGARLQPRRRNRRQRRGPSPDAGCSLCSRAPGRVGRSRNDTARRRGHRETRAKRKVLRGFEACPPRSFLTRGRPARDGER
jgi:hypothetical protein